MQGKTGRDSFIHRVRKRQLWVPLLAELVFIVLVRLVPMEARLYLYLLLYVFLIVFFRRELAPRRIMKRLRCKPRERRIGILFCVVMAVIFVLHEQIASFILTHIAHTPGMVSVKTSTLLEYTLYTVTMMVLMPVAEGLFFRRAVVSFSSGKETVLTTLLGLALAVLLYATAPAGVLILLVSLIPVTVCYLLTKNVYLSILAHLFYSVPYYMEFAGYEVLRTLFRGMISQ